MPSFWIKKTLERPRHAWDRETISPKAREAPDEEHCRTQDRPRVSLGLVLVLGTQTWFGATSLSPGPAQPHPMPCSWPSCSWGREKGTCSLDSILGKSMRPQPGIPFSFELGKHTDINNGDNPAPLLWLIFHTFTASPQPGQFSLFPWALQNPYGWKNPRRSSPVIFLQGKTRLLPPYF